MLRVSGGEGGWAFGDSRESCWSNLLLPLYPHRHPTSILPDRHARTLQAHRPVLRRSTRRAPPSERSPGLQRSLDRLSADRVRLAHARLPVHDDQLRQGRRLPQRHRRRHRQEGVLLQLPSMLPVRVSWGVVRSIRRVSYADPLDSCSLTYPREDANSDEARQTLHVPTLSRIELTVCSSLQCNITFEECEGTCQAFSPIPF